MKWNILLSDPLPSICSAILPQLHHHPPNLYKLLVKTIVELRPPQPILQRDPATKSVPYTPASGFSLTSPIHPNPCHLLLLCRRVKTTCSVGWLVTNAGLKVLITYPFQVPLTQNLTDSLLIPVRMYICTSEPTYNSKSLVTCSHHELAYLFILSFHHRLVLISDESCLTLPTPYTSAAIIHYHIHLSSL